MSLSLMEGYFAVPTLKLCYIPIGKDPFIPPITFPPHSAPPPALICESETQQET